MDILENTVKEMYRNGNPKTQTLLEEELGRDFFIGKITDRIKSFEDANNFYTKNRTTSPFGIERYAGMDIRNKVSFFIDSLIIVDVLNEGWKPNWKNFNETKYIINYDNEKNIYRIESYGYTNYSGLIFKTEELAKYFIDTFPIYCAELYVK